MKLGFHLNDFDWAGGAAQLGSTLAQIARAGDEAGFDRIGVADHFWRSHYMGSVEGPELECYTTLGFLAASTQRAKLTAMVTAATYRQPGLLAKIVTTLDVLSGGRAWLGIGAGDYEAEARGLGLPFPPLKERFERLEETLQIAHQMWSGEVTQYNGKHYHLAETLNSPQALTRPHPPILIGGGGETKTLRFIAKYGDACNLFARMGDEVVKHKLEVLKGHCDAEGRPYTDIEKTTLDSMYVTRNGAQGSMSPQQAIDQFGKLAELGIDQALISLPNVSHPDAFDVFRDEVAPAVHKIAVARDK